MQSGIEEFDMKEFDIRQAAEDIFQTYKIVESEGFEMDFENIYADTIICGDEGKIKQVISNLVANAIKYSDDTKYVRLYFEDKNDSIRLCVEDKGVGIAEDQLDKIWNRYQRASKRGSRSKDSTGLGLSICSEILKRHGAEYGVESTLGEGSTFWFEIKKVHRKNT